MKILIFGKPNIEKMKLENNILGLLISTRHNNPDICINASKALMETEKIALPIYIKALDHRKRKIREASAYMLEKLGTKALPSLINALKDTSPVIRQASASILGRIGPSAKSAIPNLIKSLNDWYSYYSDYPFIEAASESLVQISMDTIPKLIDLEYFKENDKYREFILNTIAKYGSHAIPYLLNALRHTSMRSRDSREIFNFLIKLITNEDIHYLINTLSDNNFELRRNTAKILQNIHWQPKSDKEKILLLIAMRRWKKLVKIGAKAVPILTESLKVDNGRICQGSILFPSAGSILFPTCTEC